MKTLKIKKKNIQKMLQIYTLKNNKNKKTTWKW